MKRRDFITLLGGVAAAWPIAARAQQGRIWRIGFLFAAIPPAEFDREGRGFTEGMRQLGYLEGRDFVIEWRSAEGQYGRLPDLAARDGPELVGAERGMAEPDISLRNPVPV